MLSARNPVAIVVELPVGHLPYFRSRNLEKFAAMFPGIDKSKMCLRRKNGDFLARSDRTPPQPHSPKHQKPALITPLAAVQFPRHSPTTDKAIDSIQTCERCLSNTGNNYQPVI